MDEVIELTVSEPVTRARRRKRKSETVSDAGQQTEPQPSTQESKPPVDLKLVKEQITPVIPALYFALGKLQSAIAATAFKVPHDVAARCMEFNEVEVAQLTEPTAAVLAKHANGITKYVDEVRLALLLLAVEESKLRMLNHERANLRAAQTRKVNTGTGTGTVEKQTDRDIRSEQPVSTSQSYAG